MPTWRRLGVNEDFGMKWLDKLAETPGSYELLGAVAWLFIAISLALSGLSLWLGAK